MFNTEYFLMLCIVEKKNNSVYLHCQSINQHRKGAKFEREKQIIYITKNR